MLRRAPRHESAVEGDILAASASEMGVATQDEPDKAYDRVDGRPDNVPSPTSAPNPASVTKASDAASDNIPDKSPTAGRAEVISGSSSRSSVNRGGTVLLVVASSGRPEYLRRCLEHVVKYHPK